MPLVIPSTLPAFDILNAENVFVVQTERASSQDIRPIEILIVNLMPTKIETETQLLRLLSNSPLQVKVTFLATKTYQSTHTAADHLDRFYIELESIKHRHFDGAIITGAPVEQLEYESVLYWDEMKQIFQYCETHVTSTLNICWGAQASLYYFHGIRKEARDRKLSGIFPNQPCVVFEPLLRGFDDDFDIPFSCYTKINASDLAHTPEVTVLSEGLDCGPSLLIAEHGRRIYSLGHAEYDVRTLDLEYQRDQKKGLSIAPPQNYYQADGAPHSSWRSTAHLLISNWLNYYVYQVTPFRFDETIKP